jgi:hypothetical protein
MRKPQRRRIELIETIFDTQRDEEAEIKKTTTTHKNYYYSTATAFIH